MSKKKALFWYGAIFDDINAYNIATAKEFKIKDIVSFIEDSRNEINLRESKYINYLNKQKLKFISDNYKFNLIDVPYLSQIEENNGIYRYKNNAKNFYYSLYRKESFLRKIKIQENINQLALLAYNVEISLMNFLKYKEYSEVYIFNNRFPIGNAASRACSNLGIPFITYDLVADKRMHYSKNASVLSAENFKIAVDNELNYLSKKSIFNLGEKFINHKKNSDFIAYKVFTKNQIKGYMPINPKEKFICIFTSSEDEKEYFGEDLNFPKIDQFTEITNIIKYFKNQSIKVVVRVHPNQSGMELEKKLVNEEQDSPNLIVAKGKSKFDTYALMFHSLANVSFGSSTAIEGILLKRNSYLIGRAIYDNVVKINQFSNSEDCCNSILLDIKNKRIVSKEEILSASKWAAYISGQKSSNNLKVKNFDAKISCSKKVEILNYLFRLERFLSHPFSFKISQIKSKLLKQF